MYMYDWIPSLFTSKYHNIVIGYTPIQNVFGVKKIKEKKKKPHLFVFLRQEHAF